MPIATLFVRWLIVWYGGFCILSAGICGKTGRELGVGSWDLTALVPDRCRLAPDSRLLTPANRIQDVAALRVGAACAPKRILIAVRCARDQVILHDLSQAVEK